VCRGEKEWTENIVKWREEEREREKQRRKKRNRRGRAQRLRGGGTQRERAVQDQ
jgi:hypothetical protein